MSQIDSYISNVLPLLNCILLIHFRSPLTKITAEKTRDGLAKGLYKHIFSQIICFINNRILPVSSKDSIGILDVAGFGEFKMFPPFNGSIFFTRNQL